MKSYNTDVLIIGAGPVGIFSAYQAGFLGMKTIIVDALSEIGGQPIALYPQKYIYDIPSHPKILAKDLINNLIEQAACFSKDGSGEFLMNRCVTDLEIKNGGGFCVKTDKEDFINAKAIIIATGAGAFGPNRPPIEGIEQYEGKSVHYFVKEPEDFRGKNVVIAGGGDSAVDWALGLADIAKKVYVAHRRNNFRASPASVSQMRELADLGKIELVIPFQPSDLQGNGDQITKVILKDLQDNIKEIEADSLLAFFGLSRSLGELEKWGFKINKLHSSIEVTSPTYETHISGIFAVGDVAHYEHKIKLISVGFAESAMALHYAWKYIFPNKVFHFTHSTSH